jgi:4,5-DOPA dioxygenase extradiol
MLPTLFLSHGSPMLALADAPARRFLAGLGSALPRPRAIVVASAHWDTEAPAVSGPAVNETIHDFYGFPPPLYALRYPAPGDPALAAEVAALLTAAGLTTAVAPAQGLDHGAWVPLGLMYPAHDIPVLQLAVQSWQGPAHHWHLGAALAELRARDILVIGSGGLTHNLGRLRALGPDAAEPPDVAAFCDWMHAALLDHRTDDLLDYRTKAPYAAQQHPTEEHLLPLFVALGAAGPDAAVRRLHSSAQYGALRLDAYAFG